MVAFVGKYCTSVLFSTEEAFVRKGTWGHSSESEKVGEMAEWPACFWRGTGPKQRNLWASIPS